MGRRKQFVPKKSDSKGEDQENQGSNNQDEGNAESDCGSESNDEQEKPVLEQIEARGVSPSYEKMQPETMDLLKNPFLLPAQLMALNPSLYAAQLAQLQAAQLLFAKQHEETTGRNGEDSRKRSMDDDGPLDLGSKPKYPRSSTPNEKSSEHGSESPLDLSGSKSPDIKNDVGSFNPMTPHSLLSFFSQMKPPTSVPQDIPSLMGFPPKHSPPSPGPPSRQTTWQSQWVNKGSENTKAEDVFKCVWCRESYQSLDALTTHMKEAKHHSMSYPAPPHSSALRPPVSSPIRSSVSMSSPLPSMASPPKPPIRDILKEQLPLPRKLVRGQDVWIGRADQQTRDILKCMGCGQSFRSLELLTKHMQETQHYKKVISSDQISAWRYPESQPSTKNNVNSVLTCKVCDKGHNSLKELSDHVIKTNHYSGESKPVRSGAAPPQSPAHIASKERKKALPVKKLLELERARQEVVCGATGSKATNSARQIMESGKLYCERCENKIPLDVFISHIQQCVGKPRFMDTMPKKEEPTRNSENDKTLDGNSSILGSLEQLVKGNFENSSPKRLAMSSPPTTALNPATSMGKYSIQSMFPKEPVSSPSPSNSVPSKPASPSSSRPSSTGHPSLEKMLDSPIEHTNGKIKEEAQDTEKEMSPSPISSHNGSPKRENCPKDNSNNIKFEESQDTKVNIKSEMPVVSKSLVAEEETKNKNPLAALQMLCDTQKKIPKVHKIHENTSSDSGAMLAFSWACNQAVSNDSVIKCPFCDTPFISKGAYRHHLSKMHFQKDNSCAVSRTNTPTNMGLSAVRTPSPEAKEDSTLQSKYHKYAQLAKQLSCNQN